MSAIQVLALGAGQDVGRSCVVVTLGGRNLMFDCGMHMGYKDARRFPDFALLPSGAGRWTELIDALFITHFHLDHIGALPYFTEVLGYHGPIYMTYPTRAIAPIMLDDFRKVAGERSEPFSRDQIRACMQRVIAVDLHQTIKVAGDMEFRAYYAGHVLGAAMFAVRVGGQSLVYTGDFNTTPDRHLGAAALDCLRPDLLISEATYATTLRDSKRSREREFIGWVMEAIGQGGKVLIPTFAMGRAQEVLMIIRDYWTRMGVKVPIYFSSGMAARAGKYYQLLLNWTNSNTRGAAFSASTHPAGLCCAAAAAAEACGADCDYVGAHTSSREWGMEDPAYGYGACSMNADSSSRDWQGVGQRMVAPAGALDDPHGGDDGNGGGSFEGGVARDVYGLDSALPWDRSLLHAPGPAVLFASPGMLHTGTSLEAFRAWAGDERNLVVLPGYQVAGTIGAKLTGSGAPKTVQLDANTRLEVRCKVRMLAFSAHADLRGLLGMVSQAAPRAVVLVHGQPGPMAFLQAKIQSSFGIECHAPAVGTPVTLNAPTKVGVSITSAVWEEAEAAVLSRMSPCSSEPAIGAPPQPMTSLPVSGIMVAQQAQGSAPGAMAGVSLVHPAAAFSPTSPLGSALHVVGLLPFRLTTGPPAPNALPQ